MTNPSIKQQDNSDDAPPIPLRKDSELGLFACVPEIEADGLADWLVESRCCFSLDDGRAAQLAEPGCRTFLFGVPHPHVIRDEIEEYGLKVQIDPTVVLSEDSYRPPVDKLLLLGEARRQHSMFDCSTLGLTPEHVPELIRMALDEQLHAGPGDSKIVYAPVHAMWALAELRAEAAVVPLLGLLRWVDEQQDDWVGECLPIVLARIGPASLAPVAEYLANPAHGLWARVGAAHALEELGNQHPEARSECVARLIAQLERFEGQTETLNAFLISYLLRLRAVEAAPVMERAFSEGLVDEAVHGDWEDAQIELGLKKSREHAPKPNRLTEMFNPIRRSLGLDTSGVMDGASSFDPDEPGFGSSLPYVAPPKVGRNEPCPCGSGKKFKKCCGGA